MKSAYLFFCVIFLTQQIQWSSSISMKSNSISSSIYLVEKGRGDKNCDPYLQPGYTNYAWRNYTSNRKMSFKQVNPRIKSIRKGIVLAHNFYRSRVKPTATNMLKLTWHPPSARSATNWAKSCKFLVHSNHTERTDSRFGICGQNIFVSSGLVTWKFVVKVWNDEVNYFTFGGRNNLHVVGHYTQLVWATSSKIGCGITKCLRDEARGVSRVFYNYVCEYCPTGNVLGRENRPYKKGSACEDCPNHCINRKLCKNPCPFVDKYGNCDELLAKNAQYTCSVLFNFCKATCICKNKRIH